MNHSDEDRVLALAGIYQSARLVKDLARTGKTDVDLSGASLHSLFVFDSPDVVTVFNGLKGVAGGLRTLVTQLETPSERDIEIAQYVIAMLHLADKLRKSEILDTVGGELSKLQKRIQEFDLTRSTRIAQVEQIYQMHVSTLRPQIMVRGEPLYLQNGELASHIRALLLAGIRAAILWRQCGGKKLQILFARGHIASVARTLLERT